MKIKTLTAQDVEFVLECEEEHIPVRGNLSVSGDDAQDRKDENKVLRQLEYGNQWAWCSVKMTAKYKEFEGVDYLGGCSYKSEKDFREGGYFEDMKVQALEALNTNIANIVKNLPIDV